VDNADLIEELLRLLDAKAFRSGITYSRYAAA
jgi:hypothetical protein